MRENFNSELFLSKGKSGRKKKKNGAETEGKAV
jgi:hypothetical protein